jgi:hypothetical protein
MIVPPPNYGAFKIGNLPKKGYNKNVGPNPPYIEDPTHTTTTAFNAHSTTLKNTAGMLNK